MFIICCLCLAMQKNLILNNWDVSNVSNMNSMFYGAEKFNQPLNTWDVSNVSDTDDMFYGALKMNEMGYPVTPYQTEWYTYIK